MLKEIINADEDISKNTKVGYIDGKFENNNEVKEELQTMKISEFFDGLIKKVEEEC